MTLQIKPIFISSGMAYVLQKEYSFMGLRFWMDVRQNNSEPVTGDMKLMAQAIEHLKSGAIERI